jgi:hypothetical protein
MLLEGYVCGGATGRAFNEAFSFVCTYRNWGFRGGAGGIRSESASSLQGRLLNGVGKSVHGGIGEVLAGVCFVCFDHLVRLCEG